MREMVDRKGFTVVELIVVVAVLAMLAALLLPRATQLITRTKSFKLEEAMSRVIEATVKLYNDCGTYPGNLQAFWDKAGAVDMSGNSLVACWDGPYMSKPNGYDSGTDSFPGPLGPQNLITLHVTGTSDVNGTGNSADYYVEATNVRLEIAKFLERKIDGTNRDLAGTTSDASGKWVWSCSGDNCTCQLVFYEVQ